MGVFSKPESTKPDINLISHFSNLIGNLTNPGNASPSPPALLLPTRAF
jgi:hypothetical protein